MAIKKGYFQTDDVSHIHFKIDNIEYDYDTFGVNLELLQDVLGKYEVVTDVELKRQFFIKRHLENIFYEVDETVINKALELFKDDQIK